MDKDGAKHQERWTRKQRIESLYWLKNDHNGLMARGVRTKWLGWG